MKKIALFLIFTLALCGCDKKEEEKIESNIKTITETSSIVDKRNAENIVHEVEVAYANASLISANNPTLENVKKNFSMNYVRWEEDKIIANNFECSVSTSNDELKVKCLDVETTNGLFLSK